MENEGPDQYCRPKPYHRTIIGILVRELRNKLSSQYTCTVHLLRYYYSYDVIDLSIIALRKNVDGKQICQNAFFSANAQCAALMHRIQKRHFAELSWSIHLALTGICEDWCYCPQSINRSSSSFAGIRDGRRTTIIPFLEMRSKTRISACGNP